MLTWFSPEVDAYVAKSEDFAKPILDHWRQLIFDHCPDAVEAIKWGIPHFDYKKDFMCAMASYKSHCSFSFMKAELLSDPRLKDGKSLKPIQRYLGKITKLADLPPDEEFIAILKEAMGRNEQGIKVVTPKSEKPDTLETPEDFMDALAKNPVAREEYDSKSTSFRKDYISWITAAKTDLTRQKRIEQSVQWISEGKRRFWQYEK